MLYRRPLAWFAAVILAGCASEGPQRGGHTSGPTPNSYTVMGQTYQILDSADGHVERGIASWYGGQFHGQQTALGETYNMNAMTAAHRELPLPTDVRVENLDNGRQVTVRINDRGPFKRNRIIDLSRAAASKLGMLESGTAPVEIRALPTQGQETEGAADERTAGSDAATGSAPAASTAGPGDTRATQEAKYSVQVGAFGERRNADRMVGRAEAGTNSPVRINEHRRPEGLLYRVQIGPLSDAEAVDRVTEQMRDVGIHDSHVVVNTDASEPTASTR